MHFAQICSYYASILLVAFYVKNFAGKIDTSVVNSKWMNVHHTTTCANNACAAMWYHVYVPFAMLTHILHVATQKVWLIYVYVNYNTHGNACTYVLVLKIFLLCSYRYMYIANKVGYAVCKMIKMLIKWTHWHSSILLIKIFPTLIRKNFHH